MFRRLVLGALAFVLVIGPSAGWVASAGASQPNPSLTWLNKYAEPWNKKMNADSNAVDAASSKSQNPVVPYWNRVTAVCRKLETDATSALKEPASPNANLTQLWNAMVGQTITYAKDCIAVPLSTTPKQAAQKLVDASNVLSNTITNWNNGVDELRAGKPVTLTNTPASTIATSTTTTPPTTTTAAVNPDIAIFNRYASTIRKDVGTCSQDAKLVYSIFEAAIILKDTSTGDLVKLDNASKNAQTACDMTKSNAVLSLGSVSVPGQINWIQSLNDTGISTEEWATNDEDAVLHDIQNIVESNGNVVNLESRLESDAATADQDATVLNNDFSHAASRLGIKSFSGIGLMKWDLN